MFRAIGGNAVSIVFVQAINFLFPLLALPHISRALGIHGFGVYAIVLSYGNYVLLVSDFSLNINGPLLVADAVKRQTYKQLVLNSQLLKLVLLIPSLIVFCLALRIATHASWIVIAFGALIPATNSLLPRWIMYSIDRIAIFGAASLVTKFLWLLSVILLVNGPEDLARLLGLTSLTQFLLLVVCAVVTWRHSNDKARLSYAGVYAVFLKDLRQFLAILTTSSLRDLGVVILSTTGGPASVSVYALADRVRFAIMGVVAPVSQSLFLTTSRYGIGEGGVRQRVRGLTNIAVLTAVLIASVAVCLTAKVTIGLLGGAKFSAAVPLLRIVAFAPVFTALNSIMGVNTLLASGFSLEYASAQLRSVLISAPLVLLLVLYSGPSGAAVGVLSTEVIMSLTLCRACYRAGVLSNTFALT